MIAERDIKVNRILTIYSKLVQGEIVNKRKMAELFNVNEKTIQRDIEDIRNYFVDNRERLGSKEIIYNREKKGYSIDNKEDILTKEDILSITKILLESRAFCKEELNHLINSMLGEVDVKQRKHIKDIIGNELLNYVPLKHGDFLLSKIWGLSELIRNKKVTQINYIKIDGVEVKRIVKPVAITFSEYYFYLIAYFNDFDSPTVFRVDRIKEYKTIGENFYIPSSSRFEDGEFRKRVQFMYAGKLIKMKFEFTGISVEAILDRLPTARIIEREEEKYVIEADVYGKGIVMWLLSQGKNIRIISPVELYEGILKEIDEIKRVYEMTYNSS